MTYRLCLSVINKDTYGTKEQMEEKLKVFFLDNRITEEQYNELLELLNSK